SDCDQEHEVHKRFFFKTKTIASLVSRDGLGLFDLGRIVRSPAVLDPFQPLNLARSSINPIAVDDRTRFGVSAAFGVVIFAEDKLKISVGCLFGAVGNTIQRDSVRINAVVFKGALEYSQSAVFIQRMGMRTRL